MTPTDSPSTNIMMKSIHIGQPVRVVLDLTLVLMIRLHSAGSQRRPEEVFF